MTKQFEILPHPADLKIKVFGKTKEELFKNALIAMAESISKPGFDIRSPASKKIKIKSLDLNSLLVDFLSEVLYLSQINMAVYFDVKFLKFSDTELEAEILGNKVEFFTEDIKAVTYHQLDIKKNAKNQFETIIIFDI